MTNTLRVAVIGTGNIGKRHAQVYQASPLAELVAICDLDHTRADAAATQFGVPASYRVSDMLESHRPDLVSVATAGFENGSDHYEPVMEALKHGVAVLCEKPLSNDLQQVRDMVSLAREKNLCLAVDLNHRFSPATELARTRLQQGDIGEVLFINMNLWIRNPNESSPWFHLRALHSHSIDVMRCFGGNVSRVQAFLHKGPGRATWSNCSINMQFESGALGHLCGSYDMSMNHSIERTEIGGNAGRMIIDNACVDLHYYPHDSREEVIVRNVGGMASFGDTMPYRINSLLKQLSLGTAPAGIEGSGAEALAAQEVVEATIVSWENGAVVNLPLP